MPALTPSKTGELVGRVWVLEGGKPSARDLKLGHTDGSMTEVLAGPLQPGERVITDVARPARPKG